MLQGLITELVDGRAVGAAAKGIKVQMPGVGAGAASSSSSAHKSNNDGATSTTNNNHDEMANDDDGNGEEKTRQMVTSQGCSRVFIVKGTVMDRPSLVFTLNGQLITFLLQLKPDHHLSFSSPLFLSQS